LNYAVVVVVVVGAVVVADEGVVGDFVVVVEFDHLNYIKLYKRTRLCLVFQIMVLNLTIPNQMCHQTMISPVPEQLQKKNDCEF
jgi:hypothetical protein